MPPTVILGIVAQPDERVGGRQSGWVRKPCRPASDDASPEGHYVQFGEDGAVIAITVVNARWLLEQDGKIVVTLPDGRRLETADLGNVLAAA